MSPDQPRTSPPASSRNRTGLLWSIAAVLVVVIVGFVITIIALQPLDRTDATQAGDTTETHVAEETVVVTETTVADTPGEATAPTATTTAPEDAQNNATEIRRISPVTEHWLPRDGWTVTNTTEVMRGDCLPSPVALDDGIYRCGPHALSANACFHNPDSGVFYCPINPFSPDFRAYYFTGELEDTPVITDPIPWGLELADGRQCTARQGGTWGWRADDYVGAYSCDGPRSEVVLALPGEPAVDDSDDIWTVLMGEMGQGEELPAPEAVDVNVAYYAGWQK